MLGHSGHSEEVPGGPVVGTRFSHWVQGSIPGWGTKILQAISHSPKQNNRHIEISWFGSWQGMGGYGHEES